MNNAENSMRVSAKSTGLRLAAHVAAGTLAAAMIAFAAPRPAHATPQFATQTKLPCSQCHQSATGGPLTDFGKQFQANGNKLPAKK
jgi:hypothetical protein